MLLTRDSLLAQSFEQVFGTGIESQIVGSSSAEG